MKNSDDQLHLFVDYIDDDVPQEFVYYFADGWKAVFSTHQLNGGSETNMTERRNKEVFHRIFYCWLYRGSLKLKLPVCKVRRRIK